MRFIIKLAVNVVFLGLMACSTNPYYASKINKHFYTKYSLYHEKGAHLTTNYRRGSLLPVSSEVIVTDMSRKKVWVEVVKTGEKFVVVNVPKFTGDKIAAAFEKMFSETQIDLSKFSKLELKNIEAGTIEKGMSKEAAIVAMGYPPVIRTANLSSDEWVYWKSRHDKMKVLFKNGKVNEIKN